MLRHQVLEHVAWEVLHRREEWLERAIALQQE